MITVSVLSTLYLGGILTALQPPDIVLQEKDRDILRNLVNTMLSEDVIATSGDLQSIKKAWHEKWRAQMSTENEGFHWYNGATSSAYWEQTHSFSSETACTFVLLEALTIETNIYGDEIFSLSPDVKERVLNSFYKSASIQESEVERLVELLRESGDELTAGEWTDHVIAAAPYAVTGAAVGAGAASGGATAVIGGSSIGGPVCLAGGLLVGLGIWYFAHPEDFDLEQQDLAFHAIKETKETVLYKECVRQQQDSAILEKILRSQEESILKLESEIKEQKALIEKMKDTEANIIEALESEIQKLEQKLELSTRARNSMLEATTD